MRKKGGKEKLNRLANIHVLQLSIILFLLIIIAVVVIVARKVIINLSDGQANDIQTEVEQISNNDNSEEEGNTTNLGNESGTENSSNTTNTVTVTNNLSLLNDWQIRLVNRENPLPDDFTVELENLDASRKFDKRAIEPLKQMICDMRDQGIKNIWAQSTYRSIEYQKGLYEKSINKYLKQGKSREEAQKLTDEYINKPGTSEHHLGLAVDFNNVDEGFENTKAYEWLLENASDYGFILRYPKEKENITGIEYEPWHWRYVGPEHAKKMKEQNLCLEEYVLGSSLV